MLLQQQSLKASLASPLNSFIPKPSIRRCVAKQSHNAAGGTRYEPLQVAMGNVSELRGTRPLARQHFRSECEDALNDQINVEYSISYIYHALWAYFDRDYGGKVALPGLAAFFRACSKAERAHAERLMKYLNTRGGRVKLGDVLMPEVDPKHAEKGEALYAMELALSLEKLNFRKLNQLYSVAMKHRDANMAGFVKSSLLPTQVESVKKVSAFVAQLRRVDKGLGVQEFDQELADTALPASYVEEAAQEVVAAAS